MPDDGRPIQTENLVPLWTPEEISLRVSEIAGEINRDYADQSPVLVGALKGAFVFLSDLARKIETPIEIEFIRLSSYRGGTESSGEVRIEWGPSEDSIAGRPVILVEDIVDTGLTTSAALIHLGSFHPSSLRICTLLDRPERREADVKPDYVGFTFSSHFVVGYGLDLDQRFRQLPGIFGLVNDG